MDVYASGSTRWWIIGAVVVTVLVVGIVVALVVTDHDQDPPPFGSLSAEQQVYDDTGSSLPPEARARIDGRISEIEQQWDIEIVAYVRAVDASPDETLEQVADLQSQWSEAADAEEPRTVAVLVNRNPEDTEDARAGIYAGEDLADGALSEADQAEIVEDGLIPSLAEGDVAASLISGLNQMDTTLAGEASPNAFQRWSASAGSTWAPWAGLGLTVVGAVCAMRIFGRRVKEDLPEQQPTSVRPDDLAPAVGGALALGGPAASALPATIMDLAGRGVLRIEPEERRGDDDQHSHQGGDDSADIEAVQIRLIDSAGVRCLVERAVWDQLNTGAEGSVLRGKALSTASSQTGAARDAVRQEMTQRGWINPAASSARNALATVALLASLLAMVSFVLLAAGEELLMLVGLIPAVGLAVAAWVMTARFSQLSAAGQQAAASWKAYRDGLKMAVKDPPAGLDLNVVVPDLVATDQAGVVEDLLERAGEQGQALAAFPDLGGRDAAASMVPFWTIYAGAFIAGGSGAGPTVTGPAGGSGGGAAGST